MFRSRNMTPASFEDPSQPASKKRKRQRETLSCLPCKSRKVACDRGNPCSSCVRHKRAQDCSYASDNGVLPAAQAIDLESREGPPDAVEERISRIERALSGSHSSRPPESPAFQTPKTSSSTASDARPRNACTIRDSRTVVNPFSRGRLANKETKPPYFVGSTAWTIVAPFNVFHDPTVTTALWQQWKRLFDIHASMGVKPQDTILNLIPTSGIDASMSSLLAIIPGDNECQILVNRFLGSVNEVFPIVDRSTFEDEMHAFFLDRVSVSHRWLALLASILALGYAVPVLPLADGGHARRPDRADQIATLAQQHSFIVAASYHRSQLATFQTLLALIVFKNLSFGWVDGNNGIAGLLGLASRQVFTLGLHCDPSVAVEKLNDEVSSIRRKLFVTYVRLEYSHCLESGMPLLLRSTDFAVRPTIPDHQADFMHMFPTLARAVQLTHSDRSGLAESNIQEILSSFQLASAWLQEAHQQATDPVQIVKQRIQSSFNAFALYRTHVALLALLLEQDDPKLRSRLCSDMITPALTLLDTFGALFDTIEEHATAESVKGWKVLVMAFVRNTIFNAMSYLLTFLSRSLADPSLLALRGSSHPALDSAHVFRKIRLALRRCTCTLDLSIQCVKENVAYSAYLKSVEERYRLFVEKGLADLDLASEQGSIVMESLGQTMNEMLDLAEEVLRQNQSTVPLDLSHKPADKLESFTYLTSGEQITLMDDWDWPWYDTLPDITWPQSTM